MSTTEALKRTLFALALAVPLAACGGGSDDGEMSEGTEATAGDEAMGEDTSEDGMEPRASGDIVDTASEAGQFETLLAAAEAAGLVETLRGPGPYTVFAPTDDAFAALPEGTVESLLEPENREQLRAILTYHVVSGDVRSADVMNMTEATTVQGGALPIDASGGTVRVGEATVLQPDVEASNGVIHVIDAVLMPPS